MRGEFSKALDDTLLALKILGVEVDPSPTSWQVDQTFNEVTNAILAVGYDGIFLLNKATDPRHLLAIQLLNDAGTNAYWSPSPNFAETIGLTVRSTFYLSNFAQISDIFLFVDHPTSIEVSCLPLVDSSFDRRSDTASLPVPG